MPLLKNSEQFIATLACQLLVGTIAHLLLAQLPCLSVEPSWQQYHLAAAKSFRLGDFKNADELLKQAFSSAQDIHLADSKLSLLMSDMAAVKRSEGDIPEAEKLESSALSLAEKQFWPIHPDVVRMRMKLANDLLQEKKYEQAKSLYLKQLQLAKSHENLDLDAPAALLGLGDIAKATNDFKSALGFYQQFVELKQAARRKDNVLVRTVLEKIADCYELQNDFKQEEAYFRQLYASSVDCNPALQADFSKYIERALHLQGKSAPIGKDQNVQESLRTQAVQFYELAYNFWSKGNYKNAEKFFLDAEKDDEKIGGPDDKHAMQCLETLGIVYTDMKRFADAEKLFERVLKSNKKTSGEYSLPVAQTLEYYARLCAFSSQITKQESLLKTMLAIYEKLGACNEARFANGSAALAQLYESQGRLAEATSVLEHAIKMNSKYAQSSGCQDCLARIKSKLKKNPQNK